MADRLIRVAVAGWLVGIFLPVYLSINPVAQVHGLWVVTATVLGAWLAESLWPKRWWLWLGLGSVGTSWGLRLSLPNAGRGWWRWSGIYLSRLVNQLVTSYRSPSAVMPSTASVTVSVVVIVLLCGVVIVGRRFELAVLVLASYLVAVHVFNQTQLIGAFIQLAGAATLSQLRWPLRFLQLRLLLSVVVVLMGLWGLTGPAVPWAQARTVGLRNWLNGSGFYRQVAIFASLNARTGFSENDQELGGPVYDDNRLLMTVNERTMNYLRVEVKQGYSGRGWLSPSDWRQEEVPNPLSMGQVATPATGKKEQMTITFNQPLDYIALPYGTLTVADARPLRYVTTRSRLSSRTPLKSLRLTSISEQPTEAAMAALGTVAAPAFATQLPKALPARIRQLALRLTRRATTTYGKVKAIETYLRTSETLSYSKVDARVTPNKRDYVDYFLFDSRVGYCDNFSSSMVVLLRSLGIGARWAKGFNPGQLQSKQAGRLRVQITNVNAHSWPEVYFGRLGWVPFEPTPGFGEQSAVQAPAAAATATSSAAASSSSQASSAVTSSQAQPASISRGQSRLATTNVPWAKLLGWGCVAVAVGLLPKLPLALAWLVTRTQAPLVGWRFAILMRLLTTAQRRTSTETWLQYASRLDQHWQLDGEVTAVATQAAAWTFGRHQPVASIALPKLFKHWWAQANWRRWLHL